MILVYTAINFVTIFLSFILFSLILLICKSDNSYNGPLKNRDMSIHLFGTMCGSLEQLAAKIKVIMCVLF